MAENDRAIGADWQGAIAAGSDVPMPSRSFASSRPHWNRDILKP
jgi:hypothetical protein